MNPTNPTEINPKNFTLRPTRDQNLDPEGPARPKIGFKSGLFGLTKCIFELNPNLDPSKPFFTLRLGFGRNNLRLIRIIFHLFRTIKSLRIFGQSLNKSGHSFY